MVSRASVKQISCISSKAVTVSPIADFRWASSWMPASAEGTATSATALSFGRGISFSVAAVMIPSVPSEPRNTCFMS